MNPSLYILLEGDDDERFFKAIVEPLFQSKYSSINIIRYAQDSFKTRRKLIKSFNSMKAEYIYVGDINNHPCVTAKKREIRKALGRVIDLDNVIVVVKEIESWYLAGADVNVLRRLKIRVSCVSTNSFTKEQFAQSIPEDLAVIDVMQEILNNFDIKQARSRNVSLSYFLNKWCT